MTENSQEKFVLHPQLEKDTFSVGNLGLSKILLMNDRRYPWIILVPRLPNLSDITDLNESERKDFIEEINFIAAAMKRYFQPERMNIAMLGNVVPQLHCHIIARFTDDFAWAKPVWGIGEAVFYSEEEKEKTVQVFRQIFQS